MIFEDSRQMAAAREFSDLIVSKLATRDGVHAETAIAAASRMAGTLLLGSSGLPIGQFQPGASVHSDALDRQGQALLSAIGEALAALPIHLDTSVPDYYIPDSNMPLLELLDTQELLETPFQKILAKHRLSGEEGAYSAALATALLIQHCAAVLDPHVGRAIATIGIVEASRTVPRACGVG